MFLKVDKKHRFIFFARIYEENFMKAVYLPFVIWKYVRLKNVLCIPKSRKN